MSPIDEHLRLSDLLTMVKDKIDQSFANNSYWIVAEITNHKMYQNGDRHYFDFVEKEEHREVETAKIRGIAWRIGSESIRQFEQGTGQRFENGIEVLVKVSVEFHIQFGIQLILSEVDQKWTLGNLEKQRQATLEKLLKENPDAIALVDGEYITTNKKCTFSPVIQKIAIIGSPNSAGFNDFEQTLRDNDFNYSFIMDVYQSSVQGVEAHGEIVNRLVRIYESGIKYDGVVIIRGGGAKVDFLVFDNYLLAKAVARFPIPIITGIGHSIDSSIVDIMARTSTNTPTKAAEFILSHNRRFEEKVTELKGMITIRTQRLLSQLKANIDYSNRSIINKSRTILSTHKDQLVELSKILTTNPRIILNQNKNQVRHTAESMNKSILQYLKFKKGNLDHYDSLVKIASPESILNRGFALVSRNGKLLVNGKDIEEKDNIEVMMHDFRIHSTVNKKEKRQHG